MANATDAILLLIKTAGPCHAGRIAEHLGVSRQAARQQLERLYAEGLVEPANMRAGVGRPRRSWSLTAKGEAHFPDAHAQMTVELIDAVREEFGAAGLDRLVSRREQATAERYHRLVDSDLALEARLEQLTALRRAEGYMADWRRESDGSYLLVENHCPICAAAAACQGFCRAELALFQALLAPAEVARTDHILQGARRCAYRIIPGGRA
ncbi:MAG TPA: metalloregulator ArsR/SmtB family transcription factor [Caulobacteraceae bacterium]